MPGQLRRNFPAHLHSRYPAVVARDVRTLDELHVLARQAAHGFARCRADGVHHRGSFDYAVAARAIGKLPKLGTLQPGAPGDVTILEVVEGPVEFVDTRNNKRPGKVHLKPVQTVSGGIAFGRPYNAPFSVR